ncbi:hypothetical protein AA0114_g8554 [Alternaria tenuissima]|uniref:Secreted protein n=1 Tax=Alternaria tenuissima TaxID=119927 RepID=A0A4Q4MB97_9PLEO|nr:hypothetical protein AA0114_g8554 [Alternaria tenuissima]
MVVLTALCTTLALITVTTLLVIPADLVMCAEDGVQLSSLCGNLPERATTTSTRLCPGHIDRVRFPSYTPFYMLHMKDQIAQQKRDNAQEKARSEEGIDGGEDSVINDIVRDDGSQTVTVTVAPAGTFCIKVRVEATEGIHDRA